MPDAPKSAVFLSYARDDTAAAQRIAEILRSSGVEVWFDQNELVGGDAWDQKIRRQIAECRLFIPLISATTQARREGYFRLEWRLADERTHLMAEGTPFLLPVVIDETRERDALVPKSFLHVQWTRLPAGETSEAFAGRVKKLLEGGGRGAPGPVPVAPRSETFAPSPPAKRASGWTWAAAGLLGAIAIVAGILALRPKAPAGAQASAEPKVPSATVSPRELAPAKSVAVLPFENLSTEPDSAYFTDGIHGEVLTAVSKISALTVIGRTSVLPYADVKKRNLRQIGADLGVGTVVEGRVLRAGQKVRVTVELVDTQTSRQLSSNVYERELTDIFAMQVAIAEEVAATLKTSLTTDERSLIGRRLTERPEAYELYLRALAEEEGLTARSGYELFEKAATAYQKVVTLDPGFALAYAKLTLLQSRMYWFGYMDPTPARRALAEAAMNAAARIAPDAPETHYARGAFDYFCDNNWSRALANYRRAEVGLPNDAALQGITAYAHRRLGNWPECLRHLERAIALSPRNLFDGTELAGFLLHLRRFEEARQMGERFAAQFPNDYFSRDTVIRAEFALRGDREAFLSALARAPRTARDPSGLQAAYERAVAAHDFPAAERVLTHPELKRIVDSNLSLNEPVALHRAMIAYCAGDFESAKRHAGDAIDLFERDSWSPRQRPYVAAGIARAKAFAGRTEEAVRELRAAAALALEFDAYGGRGALAEVGRTYAAIGRRDEALATLRELMAGTCRASPNEIRLDPLWSRLKDDPRFEAILRSARRL